MQTVKKRIVSVRDPADRIYSHYWMMVRDSQYEGTFEDFIAAGGRGIRIGRYAEHLRRFLQYFSKGQFLILVFEDIFTNPTLLQERLGNLLDVEPALFPAKATQITANKRSIRRYSSAYKVASRLGYTLRKRSEVDRFIRGTRDVLLQHVFTGEASQQERVQQPMKPETRAHLREMYARDTKDFVQLFSVDINSWKTFT